MPAKKQKSTEQASPINRQWFEAQMRRIGTSSARLSEQVIASGHASLLGRSLRGEREFSVGEVVALAKAFSCTVNDIVTNLGYPPPKQKVPLVGTVTARGRIELADGAPKSVSAPPDLSGDAHAVDVNAENTLLAIHNGAVLYYEPSDTPRPDAFVRLSVVVLGDQPQPVLGVLQRGRLGAVRVQVLGGSETIDSGELISATPILWMRFA